MQKLKNENIAIPVVLFAGILWSFGPLVVRFMEQPNLVPWRWQNLMFEESIIKTINDAKEEFKKLKLNEYFEFKVV